MRWSKLKQSIESRLADSVKDRVSFHLTGYRHNYDAGGRGWIEVDAKEIATMCEFRANLRGEYRPDPVPTIFGTELPVQDGHMRPRLYVQSLLKYLSMSIEGAIESHNFLIRAVALLDRRTGKRRLETMSLRADEHELVQLFYELRLEAEDIRPGEGRLTKFCS